MLSSSSVWFCIILTVTAAIIPDIAQVAIENVRETLSFNKLKDICNEAARSVSENFDDSLQKEPLASLSDLHNSSIFLQRKNKEIVQVESF
jgi:hypothetical protein